MTDTNPWVRITHPDTGGTAEVRERALPHYRALGWLPYIPEPGPKAKKAELVEWASSKDPDNTEAIAAMTVAELREQYGTAPKE